MNITRQDWLDRPTARWLAFGVFVAMLILITVIHYRYLRPHSQTTNGAVDTKYVLCLKERGSAIDRMIDEDVIDEKQAILFKTRADALCRTQFPAQ